MNKPQPVTHIPALDKGETIDVVLLDRSCRWPNGTYRTNRGTHEIQEWLSRHTKFIYSWIPGCTSYDNVPKEDFLAFIRQLAQEDNDAKLTEA